MGAKRIADSVLIGKQNERDQCEDLDLDGMIILKWI
jgi:hypothetical protein